MRRPIAVAAIFFAATLSCDSPTGLEESSLLGDWEVTVLEVPECAFLNVQKIYFTVHPDGASKSLVNIVTEWGFEPTLQYQWLLTGNMNTETRTAELNFWHTPLVAGSILTGRINADGSITGTIRDPKPGYQDHFSWGPCDWSVKAERVGPATRSP